jgi:DNA repair protein RecO (recombination protein O)
MPYYKTQAIVIKSQPFMEADKLITLFTREHGKIRAVAKSARKTSSKFGARLEVFSYVDCFLAHGRNLDIISQIETKESFYKLRESEETINAGIYLLKLTDKSTTDGIRNEELFDLLLRSLYLLKMGSPVATVKKIFEIKLMDIEGFFPRLTNCTVCKGKIDPDKIIGFSETNEGLVCLRCADKGARTFQISLQTVKSLHYLKKASWETLEKINIPDGVVRAMDVVSNSVISDHIGIDVRMM